MMQPSLPPTKGINFIAVTLCITALLLMAAGLAQGFLRNPAPASAASDLTTPAARANGSAPVYFPLINRSNLPADIVITSAVVGDAGGSKTAFLPGAPIHYVAGGVNNSSYAWDVRLTWTLTSACNTTTIYNQIVTIQPGAWQRTFISSVPSCLGITIVTAEVAGARQFHSRSTLFVAFPPSAVVLDNRQGFDRCLLPTVAQMQTWWNNSPYDVFNIYLGGSMFACPNNPLDAYWLDAVYRQGWRFILTWVGPQAPCTNYRLRINPNSSIAYQEGRAEADLAAAAANRLGFLAGKIIYYDVESYSGATTECRNAVDAFMRGWAQRLHELGAKAGGYGSPLNSYLADWANNNPPPDDVWIAHWIYTSYNPNATVWTQYLDNSLWANHRRLRQYAGGHSETWGGISLVIDSNVLDGEITALPTSQATAEQPAAGSYEISLPPQMRGMDLVTPDSGWALKGNRLNWSDDGGQTWKEITPQVEAPGEILSVAFLDAHQGWLVARTGEEGTPYDLHTLQTRDGGATWQVLTSIAGAGESDPAVGSASLEMVDENTGWLALRLQSGSSFSLGKLYLTQDGGRTWQERTLPLGELVRFLNAHQGWVAGGPSGEQLFATSDGGLTWQEITIPGISEATSQSMVGLPQFLSLGEGYLPVTRAGESQSEFILYRTDDGGDTWQETSRIALETGMQVGSVLPFSLERGGRWWAGASVAGSLITASDSRQSSVALDAAGLPTGLIALAFSGEASGWALVQEGLCQGDKLPSGEARAQGEEAFVCAQHTRLLATSDGGRTWSEVTP